jgi:biopolymer transport protein ExbD
MGQCSITKVLLLTTLIALAACTSEESKVPSVSSVHVFVLADPTQCHIGERSLNCDQLAAHLRDVLKTESDAAIFVTAKVAGLPMRRLFDVAEQLRQAGFKHATSAAFIDEATATTIEPP